MIATIGASGIELGKASDYIPLPWDPTRPLRAYQKRVEHQVAVKQLQAKKAAAPVVIQRDPVLAKALAAGAIVHQVLVNAGLGEPAASFATYASYHETAAFTSPLFLQHNNGSGIKFAGQRGAVPGDTANHYAWFNSIQDWANAYKHELTKGSDPAGATSIEEFAARLKQNGYYTAPYQVYVNGMKRAKLVLRDMAAAEWDYNPNMDYNPQTGISTPKPTFSFTDEWNKLTTLQKGGAIAAGIALLVIIAKR